MFVVAMCFKKPYLPQEGVFLGDTLNTEADILPNSALGKEMKNMVSEKEENESVKSNCPEFISHNIKATIYQVIISSNSQLEIMK